jgi:AbiJ N-terminal domain 3
VNEAIRASGAELRETDSKDGYPVFRLTKLHNSGSGRPKNLIFASHVKPDLRFRDAINNDIEILDNADQVLVYDRPIGIEGITWKHLQTWWESSNGITDTNEGKKTLYQRLLGSLPANSPPQRLLFTSYLRRFGGAAPDLPALLPEVWLHWDAKTVKERGRDALLRFRMDFLLLLPGGIRVVIEVDGKQHYSDVNGHAHPELYAAMVAADRDLKLAGYHVYRFGGAELDGKPGTSAVASFFEALFKQFAVPFPAPDTRNRSKAT